MPMLTNFFFSQISIPNRKTTHVCRPDFQCSGLVGSLFFTYLILAGSERFLIELLRLNTQYLFGLTGSQIISLAMIGIGTWFLTHPINTEQEVSSE